MKRKFEPGQRVIGNDKKASYRGKSGIVESYNEATREYFIRFDGAPVTECLSPSWLDRA